MASYEPMIRMNENAFRAPGKTQSKVGRKPLGDLTNSTKPQAKGKAPGKNVAGVFITQGRLHPKVGRKPLGDLTNSTKPNVKARSTKKSCSLAQVHKDIAGEGFCHNHKECIKANSQCMNMEYFLETVGLQKELSVSLATPKHHAASTVSRFKLETPLKYPDDQIDMCKLNTCGRTPAPKSPLWKMDLKDFEFSGFKLKEEFSGFKLKESTLIEEASSLNPSTV